MLVLSRKSGEAICIGSGITVSVLGIKGGRVRLGLSAPPKIPIHRAEIRHGINAASAKGPTHESPDRAEMA
jgi:carbon storage regulator